MRLYLKHGVVIISLVASALAAPSVQAHGTEEYHQQRLRDYEQEQQLYQYNQRIYEEQQRAQEEANQRAANQRAIREQEARNQAIRNADYWGAIAGNAKWFFTSKNAPSKELAINQSMQACKNKYGSNCRLIVVAKNTCVNVTHKIDSDKFFIAINKDINTVINQAWDQCEAAFGVGKCGSPAKPVCSGFPNNGKSYEELGL